MSSREASHSIKFTRQIFDLFVGRPTSTDKMHSELSLRTLSDGQQYPSMEETWPSWQRCQLWRSSNPLRLLSLEFRPTWTGLASLPPRRATDQRVFVSSSSIDRAWIRVPKTKRRIFDVLFVERKLRDTISIESLVKAVKVNEWFAKSSCLSVSFHTAFFRRNALRNTVKECSFVVFCR